MKDPFILVFLDSNHLTFIVGPTAPTQTQSSQKSSFQFFLTHFEGSEVIKYLKFKD